MNKIELLAALESQVKEIHVAAINATLRFKVLTGKARDAFHAALEGSEKSISLYEASLVAATVVDDAGELMFSAEDLDALRERNAEAVSAIAKVAAGVNAIGADAEEAAVKN